MMHIWTEEEIQYLRDNAKNMTIKELKVTLGVDNIDTIKNKLQYLNIEYKFQFPFKYFVVDFFLPKFFFQKRPPVWFILWD